MEEKTRQSINVCLLYFCGFDFIILFLEQTPMKKKEFSDTFKIKIKKIHGNRKKEKKFRTRF